MTSETETALAQVIGAAALADGEADALCRAVRDAQEAGTVPAMLGAAEVATIMGVKTDTIRQWRARGKMPPPSVVLSGRPAWKRNVIERWADSCRAAG